jgi:hypothetical protein
MSRTFFSLRRRRGFSPRPPAPVTIEDAGLVSGPGVGSALFHLSRCIFIISSDDADRFLKLASTRGCTVSTMVLSATRGLVLFRVIREGIGLTQRLSATGTCRAYRRLGCSPSNPSVSRTNWPPPEKDHRRWRALPRDAQAACDFSLSASKFSPFFHRVSVMAAILRASVRRAIVGLMPLASDLW